mmetsp:Transcript_33303/g.68127  ORF Transcript_33303/g.68127 Transcript_33303/m.68127 type:complete len:200 (+) Transcript_33303:28-627(+)
MMFRGRLSNAIKPRSLYPLYGAKNRRQIGTSSWSRYSQLLERHPLPTKALTSGILCGAGDASCQLLEKLSPRKDGEEAPTFDAGRTTRFALVGAAVLAPTLHVWYSRLNSLFPGCSMAAVLKRLALDQLGFAPLFIPVFMSRYFLWLDGENCLAACVFLLGQHNKEITLQHSCENTACSFLKAKHPTSARGSKRRGQTP